MQYGAGKIEKKGIVARVFVVGCPRSGTTLVQSLLASHPTIHSFPESHFFALAVPRIWWIRTLGLPSPYVEKGLKKFLVNADLLEMEVFFPKGLSRLRFVCWTQSFMRILDEATSRLEKTIWVEKTPRHLHYIKLIQKLVPNPRFIHVLRSGYDTVASLFRVTNVYPEFWGGKRSVEQCVRRWKKDVRISLNYFNKPGHLLVRYENLVSRTPEVLKEMCEFLGVDYMESMIEEHRFSAERIILPHQDWVKDAMLDIKTNVRGRTGDMVFDTLERDRIKRDLEDTERELDLVLPVL